MLILWPGCGGGLLLLATLLVLLVLAGRARLLLPATLVCLCLAGCAGDRMEKEREKATKEKAEDKKVLKPVDGTVEGTPWEKVVAVQAELLDFFETGKDADSILKEVKRWKRNRKQEFKELCRSALDHYARDPDMRMSQFARAGQAWSVARDRIGKLSKDWGPAQSHDVGILLNEFSCR